MSSPRRVALVTLGCARNEVDSEELAARFAAGGFALVDDAADADAVVVNTCGFVEQAKQDSIDTLLEARGLDSDGRRRAVVAVGCLAERYGAELASSLPEADAVLGFDSYETLASTLGSILSGAPAPASHAPRDRRALLPITPVERAAAARPAAPADLPDGVAPASGPRRHRLTGGPVAPLKLASGCDRRCSFCAIPSFRGAFVSRPPEEVLAEAEWLAGQGVRELHLVSENSTSYGKDLGDVRLLERLLPSVAAVPGIDRVRLAYLQPAETRPSLVEAIASTPGVAAYYDLSFQHASPTVLRSMRRFGGTEAFLGLIRSIRALAPEAGIRSNFIVGFPGERASDYAELERFLVEARLDAIGVFRYSDEDGTEAAGMDGKVRSDVAARRYERLVSLAEELTAQRAEERVGSVVDVLVEEVLPTGEAEGRAHHQAPEVDGSVLLRAGGTAFAVGELVRARVVAANGVDLVAEPIAVEAAGPA
ncbi:MAG TPA: 30S ribosomal protein S12 methylthiotransferase RimO [Frankiaceae bacterium]|jgi:ribosomal protein S12 methylthiotransferase RimO|nr:30S ribosomal protein S12 methylthiotransferase RimO [Frankiaceae bacterium]